MKPRVLIVGTCFLNSDARIKLLQIWHRLVRKNSPDCDVFVIDSCSPTPAKSIIPNVDVFRFATDVGHPIHSSEPSRDFLFGLEYAITSREGYDYVVHWETDCLCARPMMDVVLKMQRAGVKVAAPFEANMQFIETQLLFFNVDYLRESRFIERYRESYRPQEIFSERCVEMLCESDLFTLPLRGMRNDYDLLKPSNFKEAFRHGCDYLSHCKDFSVYVEFLKMNGAYK